MPKRPIRAFEASVRARLEALGFVRRRGPFILPIDDLRFGWLGLNRGTSGGVLHVHPNVGAGHQAIADLVAAGRPESPKAPRLPMPVVFAPLYILTDGLPLSWDFETEADVESVVTGLVSAVADVGIPFMRRFETLDDFITGMRGGFGGADDYDLPAALILAGRRDEASIELRPAPRDRRASVRDRHRPGLDATDRNASRQGARSCRGRDPGRPAAGSGQTAA